jgi:integrase
MEPVPAKHPRLIRRGAVYHFRVHIPLDLRDHYRGRKEITASLRTTDPKEALRLVRTRSEAQEQEFDRIRAGCKVTEFTNEQIAELVQRMMAEELHADEQSRMQGSYMNIVDEDTGNLQHLESELRRALARGDVSLVRAQTAEILHGVGVTLDSQSTAYRALAYQILKASVETVHALLARNRGDVVKTPSPPPAGPKPSASRVTLRHLLDNWRVEREPTARSRQEWELSVRRFEQLHGSLSVQEITKAHIVAVRGQMLQAGLSVPTARKNIGALSALLQMAADDELVPTNVARGVKPRGAKVKTEARLPYDANDLQRILAGPVHANGERPQGGAGEAAFWLPLLALWTGARLEELGQLRPEDVRHAEGGILYLEITDRGEGTSVKTASSRRRVPIHDELIRLGFLDYVCQCRTAGHDRLFPELRRSGHGRWTPAWSQWWGRYCRRVLKLTDNRKVFHSFRHSFKDACRACGITEEIHDALTGHSGGGGVGRGYGARQFPLRPLVEAMKRLRYVGIEGLHFWGR